MKNENCNHFVKTTTPNAESTKECSSNTASTTMKYLKHLLKSKNNDMKNLTIEEILDIREKLYAKGQFKNCINICNKALKLPKFESIVTILKFTLGNCYQSLHMPQEAARYFLELMSLDQVEVPFLALFFNVSKMIESDQGDKKGNLIALYKCLKRRVQNSNGEDLDSRLKLAALYADIDNFQDSIDEYEAVLKLDSKQMTAMYNLSVLYMQTNDTGNLGRVYSLIGDYLKEQIAPREVYSEDDEESNINKCIKYYTEAHKLLPNNTLALINLSQLHRMIDRHKEALRFIECALKIDDKDFRVYYEGFLAYEDIGDFHTAKEMIRICLVLNITFVKGFNAFGNLMRKEKMYDLAIELFETALMREPENVLVLNNYATCFLEMGNKSKAKDIYLQAYHLDHNLFEVNCNLSSIYRKEYNYDKAIEHILKAKDNGADNPQVYTILASIYIAAGLVDLAISSCRKARSLDQDNCPAGIQLASCLKQVNKFSESMEICLSLLRTNPKNTEAFLIYAECVVRTNMWSDFEENKANVMAIAEYHLHVGSTSLRDFIADYLIVNSQVKFWIYEVNCQHDIQNAAFALDTPHALHAKDTVDTQEDNSSSMEYTSEGKVGFLIEEIREEFTLALCVYMLSCFDAHLIIFESEKDDHVKCFNWQNHITDWNIKKRIIDLSDEESPKTKAALLIKHHFDVIIFLENLSFNPYSRLRKIYQTLSVRTANLQIILPYNGCPKNSKVFDYTITDEAIPCKKKGEKFIIFTEDSSLFCMNPFYSVKSSDPFIHLRSDNLKLIANFSESYKIDNELFASWCEILRSCAESVLILKFCNEESVVNLRMNAALNAVDPQRIVFISFSNRELNHYASAEYVQYIDLYLGVQTVNGDFEVFFCLFKNIPVITLSSEKFPISSFRSYSILNTTNSSRSKIFCFNNRGDYVTKAIRILKDQESTGNRSTGNSHDEYDNKTHIDKFIISIKSALNLIHKDKKRMNVYV